MNVVFLDSWRVLIRVLSVLMFIGLPVPPCGSTVLESALPVQLHAPIGLLRCRENRLLLPGGGQGSGPFPGRVDSDWKGCLGRAPGMPGCAVRSGSLG